MSNFRDLLLDNIISKSELVIKRHEYLGLETAQAAFLAKIFVNNRESYSEVKLSKVADLMNVDIEVAKLIIEPLIIDGLLPMKTVDEIIYLNFDLFITRLLESYEEPKESDSIDEKLKWIDWKVNLILTDNNKEQLREVIKNTKWDVITKVINKLSEQDGYSFPLLISFIDSAKSDFDIQKEKVSEILNVNWLK